MNTEEIVSRLRPEHAALLADFAASADYRRLPPHEQSLVWSAAFLETMQSCELCWAEVDVYTLRGLLFGAMSWLIDAPPRDPAAMARELEALVGHAAGVELVLDAPACRAYLASGHAVPDIAAWVAPVEEGLPPLPRMIAG